MRGTNTLQYAQAVHAGHFDVQQHNAGVYFAKHCQSGRAVGRGGHNLNARIGGKHELEQAVHDRRVINDEDANRVTGGMGMERQRW